MKNSLRDKLKKALTLFLGVYRYNILRHFKPLAPTGLQINVTYRCNSKCQMCQIWKVKPKNELSFKEWQRIMKDQIFSSVERLTITGGEPTLHPELVRLARLFISSMPQLQFLVLVTNGFLTARTISLVKTLAKLSQGRGINFTVSVSLDGIGKMHDEIRGVSKAFEKTSSTILGLKELQAKYHFWLNVAGVTCQKNLYHINGVRQWCQRRGIDFNLQLVGFHKSYVQNIEKKQELDFRDNGKKYLHSILKELSRPSFRKNLRFWLKAYYWNDMLALYRGGRRTTPCPFVLDAFVLDSLGDVYYCLSEKKIGNCRQGKSVSEIYYHPKNLKFRRRLVKSACPKCNSGCFVSSAIAKDFKKFIWFYFKHMWKTSLACLAGKRWQV